MRDELAGRIRGQSDSKSQKQQNSGTLARSPASPAGSGPGRDHRNCSQIELENLMTVMNNAPVAADDTVDPSEFLVVNGGVKPCHCGGAKVGHLVARLGA